VLAGESAAVALKAAVGLKYQPGLHQSAWAGLFDIAQVEDDGCKAILSASDKTVWAFSSLLALRRICRVGDGFQCAVWPTEAAWRTLCCRCSMFCKLELLGNAGMVRGESLQPLWPLPTWRFSVSWFERFECNGIGYFLLVGDRWLRALGALRCAVLIYRGLLHA